MTSGAEHAVAGTDENPLRLLVNLHDKVFSGRIDQVFVVGRLPNSLDSSSLRFPHRKLPRDSVFVDSFSSNPLFLLHDGSDIHSVRLADPTQYGYFSRDGEYYKLVSNILAPQAN
mgnify:CR=1 FL=1